MSYPATAVLDELNSRGIEALVVGDRLRLQPRNLVVSEILEWVRPLKADLIRQILLREVGADRGDSETYLLNRLRSGQQWLDEILGEVDAMPNAGLGTPLNNRFVYGLDMWLRLEGALRSALNYDGCIHAALKKTCPGGTAAPYSACMEATN